MLMFMLSTNMIFLILNHPMSMGLILIIQTMMASLISGMIIKNFWMSYILLITMLSGMLVLFIYMSSVASNEKFKNNMKMWIKTLLMSMMSTMSLIFISKMIIKNNYSSLGMTPFKSGETLFLSKIFNLENMSITIMIVMYLFYTMIVSTHLVNIFEGPMRKKM
uniref:NADH dehydrogenase subunit 6 n=1 Tax=Cyrtorhinus lividipennis TaxID=1032904 RepID=UPI00211459A5|nr:NADH dehydrogenase subunit 6 [Cyrtorhinus lividipennis]USH90826.1 NADH dehydrogenase subunit 6 [Cyrtorhinus lividipennis]